MLQDALLTLLAALTIDAVDEVDDRAELLLKILPSHLFLCDAPAIGERRLNIALLQIIIVKVLLHLVELGDLVVRNLRKNAPQAFLLVALLISILILLVEAAAHLLHNAP